MRCDPSTRSERMVRTTCGAINGAGAGVGAAAGAACCGGAVWAWTGSTMPAERIVPARSVVVARTPICFALLAVTNPPQSEIKSMPVGAASYRPAPTTSADQPAQIPPHAERIQIVERHQHHQRENRHQSAAKRPFHHLRLDRPPPDRLDSVEQQMPAIQDREWQEVNESEINRNKRDQEHELGGSHRETLARDLGDPQRPAPLLDPPGPGGDLAE